MQFILAWVNCAQRNRPLGDEGNKNKKEKPPTKNGRRSLWRLEASSVTNQRLARIEEGEEDSGMDDLEANRIAES